MQIYIYDIEVFAEDWLVTFQDPYGDPEHFIEIHNNNHQLRAFLTQGDLLIGGFNNKYYDDWVIMSMISGADNLTVKRHNDYIINGGNGWEFPFIQYQKRSFKSFDLRDDLPKGLSLKAIEGNLEQAIVESSVSFDIDRKLTPGELEEVKRYCGSDVRNTVKLFHKRAAYIESKRQVARIKGMDESEAIGLTNAKLTAKFLDAQKKKWDDEMVYETPEELRIGKYAYVLDFFKDPIGTTIKDLEAQLKSETRKIKIRSLTRKLNKIKELNDRYKCNLETLVAGVPHVYGWGGIHGATNNLYLQSDDDTVIVTIDVGSYYPSLMLQYNYISRNIPSAAGYADIYHTRLTAKHTGDDTTASALKLVLNTCYGAMKNRYNDLYDPRNASAVCISGMLFLTDLIDKLESVKGFQLIQSNTDGIIIRYPKTENAKVEEIVSEWEKRTRFNMEYTIIKVIAQKDVNNYVVKCGETYMIQDGKRVVTKKDKNKLKLVGGYVSLAQGGDLKNNSMTIVHKALVEYLMNGIDVEETIHKSNDPSEFQIIAKTGSTYDGTYWMYEGKEVTVQRVNRVYATKDTRCGTIYKRKGTNTSTLEIEDTDDETGRTEKIASLPNHCLIDNENQVKMEDIDKAFYINLTKQRIIDFFMSRKEQKRKKIGVSDFEKIMKDLHIETRKEPQEMAKNIYQKLTEARLMFQKSNPKKTGINRFAEFKYFELEDIVPTATKIFDELKLSLVNYFTHDNDFIAQLFNTENPSENIVFSIPHRQLGIVSQTGKNKMNELQGLGSEITYLRRYGYMLVLDIMEADAIDATIGKEDGKEEKPKTKAKASSTKPATPEEREEAKKELIDKDGNATDVQIKSIKNGLKKLREKEEDHEDYITATVKAIKAGITKEKADAILIEIGEKLEG